MSAREKIKTYILNNFRFQLAVCFALALSLRVLAVFALHNFKTVYGFENEELALNMLAGKGYSFTYIVNEMPSALVGPIYTWFLYLHFLLFGKNYLPIELSQALIGSLSAVLLALLGKKIAGEKLGIVSGLLAAVYPTYVYWTTLGLQLTVDVFLIELCLLLALLALEKQKLGWQVLCGIALGVAALSKSFYLSFPVLYLAWLWIWKRPPLKKLIVAAAVWGFCAGLVILPWTLRNYRVFGAFVPLTTNGGPNLWYGNNDRATGSLFTEEGKPVLETIPEDLRQKLAQARTEAEKDRLLGQAGKEWIKAHPGKFLALIPYRLRAMWWFDPEMESSFPLVRKLIYLVLLLFTLPGMVIARKSWRSLSIFYLLYLWQSAFYSFYVGQARFRYLIEFSFLIFSAFTLLWLWDRLGAPLLRKFFPAS